MSPQVHTKVFFSVNSIFRKSLQQSPAILSYYSLINIRFNNGVISKEKNEKKKLMISPQKGTHALPPHCRSTISIESFPNRSPSSQRFISID